MKVISIFVVFPATQNDIAAKSEALFGSRASSRASVETEFLSPYPPHANTHGDPHGDPHTHNRVQGCRGDGISIPIPTPCQYQWGSPYTRQSLGLQWGRNFYPHTHPIPIPMGIPIGIHIPTADLASRRLDRGPRGREVQESCSVGVSDWPAEDDRVELGSVDVPGLSVLVVDHVRWHAGHRRLVDRCAVVRRLDDRSTRPESGTKFRRKVPRCTQIFL